MALDKIKVRNLDDDIFNFFRRNDQKITFDALDPNIVAQIKNGSATQIYNDAELRNRIINLEKIKLNNSDAANTYRKIADSYTKAEVNNLVNNCKTLINAKLTTADADKKYIIKQDNIITENLLSTDLINKVNARYENKRPEGSNGSEVTTSEFNLLKTQVGNNTTNLTTLKNYVSSNVLTTDNKITRNYLDSSITNALDNARQKTVLIGMSDLSADVQKKLNNTISGSFDSLENGVQTNKNDIADIQDKINLPTGYVMMGDLNKEETGLVSVKHCSIYAEDIWVMAAADFNTTSMKAAFDDEVTYIIVENTGTDSQGNEIPATLYNYNSKDMKNYNAGAWTLSKTIGATELLAGRFASGYKNNNLYFGTSVDEFDVIVDVNSFATKAALASYLTIASAKSTYTSKTDFNTLNSTVSTLKTTISTNQANISTNKSEISALKTEIANLKKEIEALKTASGTK